MADIVLALAMASMVATVIAAAGYRTGRLQVAAFAFAAAFGALVLVRHRWPGAVLVATVLGIFTYYALELPPIGIALPAVAALYSAAELGRTRSAAVAGLVLVATSACFRIADGLPATYLLSYELITNVALVAAAIALGATVRSRREIARQQELVRRMREADQGRAAELRLHAERLRIARDLHDSVGHWLAVIALHSNVAAEAVGTDDAGAADAIEQVRKASRDSLRALRATVKVLRSPTPAGIEPDATGIADIPRLVATVQAAGLDVHTSGEVRPGEVDDRVDATAFRIVQEALTNTLRHSRARQASIHLEIEAGTLQIEVADDGRAEQPITPGGHGLRGMAERARALGGGLTAGPQPRGGFLVSATLPTRLKP